MFYNSFISGRTGRVSCKGKEVAYIGEINPQVLDNFALETPVAALELNLTDLFELKWKNVQNATPQISFYMPQPIPDNINVKIVIMLAP